MAEQRRIESRRDIEFGSIDESESAFTVRAILLGVLLAALHAAGVTYSTSYLQGSFMALGTSTVGAVFILFLLTALVNPVLRMVHPRLGLNRRELLLIYIMMVMAAPLGSCFSSGFASFLADPYYFATPENEWGELVLPYLPHRLVMQDPRVVEGLFEGLPKGSAIPWGAWAPAFLAWMPFLASLFVVMVSTMVILRKQWVENERLIYPLTVVPLAMTEQVQGERVSPFFRNPVMWVGFAIPALWGTLHGLYNYYPDLFVMARDVDMLHIEMPLFRNTTKLLFYFRFNILGFFYFLKTEIAFSLWFFNLVANMLRGSFAVLGIQSSDVVPQSAVPNAILAYHSIGAMAVLFFGGLWTARRHLGDVLRKAIRGDATVDDSGEALSYRAAVLLVAGGSVIMGWWLWQIGLSVVLVVAVLLLGAMLIIGFTRVVAESGLSDASLPVIPAGVLIATVGSSAIGAHGLAALTTTYVWTAGVRSFVMTSAANSLKLGDYLERNRRPLFWLMLVALGVAVVSGVWTFMALSHEYGALNLSRWSKVAAYTQMGNLMRTSQEANPWGWVNIGIGAAVMLLLMVARWSFVWWPLHPLGYPIGPIWIMDHLWFNMFLAWLIKVVVLRYGGVRLYRSTRPFFIGLILGQLVPGGVFLFIDHFTGMVGNVIFWG
jgi:hypothetical protein